jgi:hypothetical protein
MRKRTLDLIIRITTLVLEILLYLKDKIQRRNKHDRQGVTEKD